MCLDRLHVQMRTSFCHCWIRLRVPQVHHLQLKHNYYLHKRRYNLSGSEYNIQFSNNLINATKTHNKAEVMTAIIKFINKTFDIPQKWHTGQEDNVNMFRMFKEYAALQTNLLTPLGAKAIQLYTSNIKLPGNKQDLMQKSNWICTTTKQHLTLNFLPARQGQLCDFHKARFYHLCEQM